MTYKTILEAVVGSTVHGTSVDDGLEDLDLMAIVIESLEDFAGFDSVVLDAGRTDHWIRRTKPMGVRSEAGDIDYVAYGLRKYLKLVLKANPSVLIPLFAPPQHTRVLTQEGIELRELIPMIASKTAHASFRGYMLKQYERLMETRGQKNVTRPELIEKYGIDTKYAGHIIRLGIQGAQYLLQGNITLPMPEEDRQLCLDVRTGKYTLSQISDLCSVMEHRLNDALAQSPLPDKPNYAYVEQWMLSTYRAHWSRE